MPGRPLACPASLSSTGIPVFEIRRYPRTEAGSGPARSSSR